MQQDPASEAAAITALRAALDERQLSVEEAQALVGDYFRAAPDGTPEERLAALVPLIDGHPGEGGALVAVVCGAMVEQGASPESLIGPAIAGLITALDEPEDSPSQAFTMWSMAVAAVLQRSPEVRRQVREDTAFVDLLTVRQGEHPVDCVLYAAMLLEHERMLVLHPETRRGFWIDVDGVADNFQLHTLLAAALIGDPRQGWLEGTPPTAAQVRALTDPQVSPECKVDKGWFNLVNWTGFPFIGQPASLQHSHHWIWNEGMPADIIPFEGTRVIVLDRPPYARSWNAGRFLPAVPASVTVTGKLTPSDYEAWEARIGAAAGGIPTMATEPPKRGFFGFRRR